MKVLSTPVSWSHICKCERCSSELEIDEDDLVYKEPDNFFSAMAGREVLKQDYHYVICGICFNEVRLNEEILPTKVLRDGIGV